MSLRKTVCWMMLATDLHSGEAVVFRRGNAGKRYARPAVSRACSSRSASMGAIMWMVDW